MYRHIVILGFFLTQLPVFGARNSAIPSDTLKVQATIQYLEENFLSQPNICILKCQEAIEISEQLNYTYGIAECSGWLAYLYTEKGLIEVAMEYWNKTLLAYERADNQVEVAKVLNNLGYMYKNQGERSKALTFFFRSLKIRQNLSDSTGVPHALINIGSIYDDEGRYDSALYYFAQSLWIASRLKDHTSTAAALNNIGTVFDNQNMEDSALFYYQRALELERNINNKAGIGVALLNVGRIYMDQEKFEKAEENGMQSLAIGNEIGYPQNIMHSAKYLMELYQQQNRWKEAYEMMELSVEMKDSVQNERSNSAILKQQFKYEFEKRKIVEEQKRKEQNILEQQEILRRNRIQFSGIFIFVLILFAFVLMSGRFKINERTAEALIFFTFLLFFEFLLVVIDPYIDQYTSGQPIYKLGINAVLAAGIFPLHSFFENTLKSRLIP